MIKVNKGSVDVEGKLGVICTELACAITGVFETIGELDEELAQCVVSAAIMTGIEQVKDNYGVTLCKNIGESVVVNIQMVNSASADGTTIEDIMKEVESYRKNNQGADDNVQPKE